MKSLRFCMLTTFYPPYHFGGDAIGVQRFSQALVRQGHQVTVLQDVDGYKALRPGDEPAVPQPSDGVEVVRLRSRAPLLSSLLTHQTGHPVVNGRSIRGFLNERCFDVINFHNISLVGGPGLLAAGDAVKLYMAHDHWLVCPMHVLWRHRREVCTGRQCVRCSIVNGRPPQWWRHTGLLERELRHVDAFVAMSEFSRAKHREFGFPRSMEVVNHFLPEFEELEHADERPHERPYFLFVGRLERIKGLDDVIPLFARYEEADLLVAGDGEHGTSLRALGAAVKRVRFLGHVDSAMLDRCYRHALALLVPSIGFETFGLVLIESFRHGTPVIARRIGPFPEIVERDGGGLLFGTPAELVDSMRRIQSEPGLRARLAREARGAFRTHWTEGVVLPRYLDVVLRAAQAKGRTRIIEALSTR